MAKILLADDHRLVRSGLKQIINQDAHHEIFEASNAGSIFNYLQNEEINLVILDINLPGKNGIEILQQMKEEGMSIPVLVLSMYPPDPYAVRAFRAGAMGYLTKDAAPTEMMKAIDDILNGKKYISVQYTEDILGQLASQQNQTADHRSLSDREFNVFIRLAQGAGISTIAGELNLSVKTISTYKARVMEKMNMHTPQELTSYALKNNLINEV